jgi:Sugar-transfer associated ATP-grasp
MPPASHPPAAIGGVDATVSLATPPAPLRRRLKHLLRGWGARLNGVRLLAERERQFWSAAGLPVHRRVGLWLHGYNGFCHPLYGFEDSANAKAYLSEWQRAVHSKRPNQAYAPVLDDKLLFWLVLGRHSGHLLPILAQVERGVVRVMDGTRPGRRLALAAYLDRLEQPVVFKPSGSSHGKGVLFCERREGTLLVDGQPASGAEVARRIGSHAYLITPRVEQAAYAREVFPEAVNTIRLLTFYDEAGGGAFVGRAAHRFGSSRTRPVDAWMRGGTSAPVDLASGRLGRACEFPKDGRIVWHAAHPETGGQIEGVEVPHWPRILAHIGDLASTVPFLPYIGWDVVATDDGFMILEGNARPDVNLLQVHEPLLTDPRIAQFYRARSHLTGSESSTRHTLTTEPRARGVPDRRCPPARPFAPHRTTGMHARFRPRLSCEGAGRGRRVDGKPRGAVGAAPRSCRNPSARQERARAWFYVVSNRRCVVGVARFELATPASRTLGYTKEIKG